jgi:NAD(P)-dependent dehydrogenase (short-subunit alcohol dehydrogenase family)
MSKVAIVTGCNTGIGRETARDLVAQGFAVVFACRDKAKAEQAMKEIEFEVGAGPDAKGSLHFIQLDNARMKSVKDFAAAFRKQFSTLHALVLNAGTGYVKREDRVTEDGFDTQFQVNYLAHFLLTQLLLPVLKKTPGARVVALSSVTHRNRTATDDWEKHAKKTDVTSYPSSKLALAYLAFELPARTGVAAVAVNPGAVMSDIWRWMKPTLVNKVKKGVMSCLFLTPAQGSVTSVYAATADVPSEETMYLSPYPVNTFTYFDWWGPFVGPTVCKAASKVYDKNKRSYLWEYSMQLCQKYM